MSKLSHINQRGDAAMVDVSEKQATVREAKAQAMVHINQQTVEVLKAGNHPKGDVFACARIAGIQAAKQTSNLIPLCHPLMLSKVAVELELDDRAGTIAITSLVKLTGQTGVEMEALTAASVAALTVYDMCKAVQKDILITDVKLLTKTGGKSGDYQAT